ncbi:hypothetical protein [Klebsiella quasipneumoniae]|uniref:hypothetical protein n=1 Tax=Klebsiella quasipneumoniae TaxID=1463165 RepID=UPI00296FE7DC|nr:hypothetical protein [Klebsiella quasipneumoniae]MDW3821481.1 hypothetical protein [Klebsiella quasipneumoniae]
MRTTISSWHQTQITVIGKVVRLILETVAGQTISLLIKCLRKGIFYGKIGLMDGNGRRLTSIDIWFRVLGDDVMFGLTGKYYSARVEKLIRQIEAKSDQAINDLYQKYNSEVKLHESALQENTQSFQLLSAQAASILSKLQTNDVITISKYNQDKQADRNMLQTALSKINTSIREFSNSRRSQNRLSNGKDGVFIAMDSGHGYIYWNGSWTDCGYFVNITDKGAMAYQPYLDQLPLKTHKQEDYQEETMLGGHLTRLISQDMLVMFL